MITIHNVVGLLQDGVYVKPSEAKKQMGRVKQPIEMTCPITMATTQGTRCFESQRQCLLNDSLVAPPPGRETYKMPAQYQVYDGFSKLDKRHLNRIVGVFTTGQDWEFKDWPGDVLRRIPR